MKYLSFTTLFTDIIETLPGFSLDDDYNISEIQFLDCFKQTSKEM